MTANIFQISTSVIAPITNLTASSLFLASWKFCQTSPVNNFNLWNQIAALPNLSSRRSIANIWRSVCTLTVMLRVLGKATRLYSFSVYAIKETFERSNVSLKKRTSLSSLTDYVPDRWFVTSRSTSKTILAHSNDYGPLRSSVRFDAMPIRHG